MDNEYISHHGIKGQRWGVEHGPPYPVKRTSDGKPTKVSIIKKRLKANAEVRATKKAAKKEEREEEKHKKLRSEAIRNPKSLYKNKDQFSRSEIEEIIKEIEFDRKIKDVQQTEVKRGLDKYKDFQTAFGTTALLMKNAKDIYGVAADVHNAMVDAGKTSGKKWPTLGGQSEKKDGDSSGSQKSEKKDEDSGGSKKPEKKDNSSKKSSGVDTSVKMSSPTVNERGAHGVKAAKWVVEKHGATRMGSLDDALAYMNANGPLSFYSGMF